MCTRVHRRGGIPIQPHAREVSDGRCENRIRIKIFVLVFIYLLAAVRVVLGPVCLRVQVCTEDLESSSQQCSENGQSSV